MKLKVILSTGTFYLRKHFYLGENKTSTQLTKNKDMATDFKIEEIEAMKIDVSKRWMPSEIIEIP